MRSSPTPAFFLTASFCLLTLAACAGPARTGDGTSTTLSGTVTYLPRIALPPDAVVHVRLDDISQADAPAVTLAEQTIPAAGRQVPIPFALSYDPTRIEARNRYAVRAEIHDGSGALRWTTDTAIPVLSQGAPSRDVEVRVVQVTGTDGAGALTGATWRLVEIETPDGGAVTPEADETNTVTFGTDGRLTGQADCNRFMGPYTLVGDGRLTVGPAAGTLAACLPPSSGDAFLQALDDVTGYALTGDRLRLTTGDGRALTLARQDGAADAGGMNPQAPGRTFVFTCDADGDSFSFTTRTGPGEAALWLPERLGERYLVLGQTPAASGARYEGSGVVFWSQGDEALLEVDGERYSGCASDPQRAVWEDARLSGVGFRAVGQEPGWVVEIAPNRAHPGEGRIRFSYSYGQEEVYTPVPAPEVAAGRTTYHAVTEAHDLRVVIEEEPCTDAMSGEAFEATVTVDLDGETYRGCGRTLR